MIKNSFIYLVALVVTLFFSSCVFDVNGTVGKGPIVDEHITVSDFTAVTTSSSADVVITKGESLSVILSDYENLIAEWDVKVINHTLVVETKPFTSLINSRAKVTVVLPGNLYEAKINGSGSININSAFDKLEKVSITGSGSVIGNADADYLKLALTISGSGSIDLYGTVNELNAITTGSGKMYLSDLIAKDALCKISGSGNMYVHATKSLYATISGSGNIVYEGTPTLDVHSSGSGNVRPK